MDKIEKTLKEVNNLNLYTILEISKTDDKEIIKKAYKKLIKKYHPDKNKDSNTVEKFDKIKLAYELLKHEDLKALYDSLLHTKEERKIKKKQMNEKRKKFIEDLENREKVDTNKDKSNFYNQETKEKNKYKEYEEEFINYSNIFTDEPKKKTLNQKLNQYGIKIKWKKDLDLIFTKDILSSYFKDFGSIDEIVLLNNENKALILFNNDKTLKEVLNTNNHIINKLFKIKKYSKKEILKEKEKPENLKNKFLDSETLEMLRNQQFMNNLNYINQKNIVESNKQHDKDIKINNNHRNNHDFLEDINIKKNDMINKNNSSNNLNNNYYTDNNNNVSLDLDLDSMEKLIFDKIRNKK